MNLILERTKEGLSHNGFAVRIFDTAAEAADCLAGEITGASIGFGGSMTLREMGLYERLAAKNRVFWHWSCGGSSPAEVLAAAATADVYFSSVNGLSESGEIVNIDGTGNRVAATLYGHKKVYFIAGVNKIAPDLCSAIDRARNIAAPLNAQRLGVPTPCAAEGDRCYDCDSPARICRALNVLWKKPNGCDYEVILIGEKLGY